MVDLATLTVCAAHNAEPSSLTASERCAGESCWYRPPSANPCGPGARRCRHPSCASGLPGRVGWGSSTEGSAGFRDSTGTLATRNHINVRASCGEWPICLPSASGNEAGRVRRCKLRPKLEPAAELRLKPLIAWARSRPFGIARAPPAWPFLRAELPASPTGASRRLHAWA